jgi:hypothetical protein
MFNLAIKQATYQDIIDISENIVGEIINGQLETHPRPRLNMPLQLDPSLHLPSMPFHFLIYGNKSTTNEK